MGFVDLKTQEIESLKKEKNSLYTQWREFGRLKDKENRKEIRRKIEEIENGISKVNIEIGAAYEKQALSLIPEEKLSILLRSFEYYKVSSYEESIRVLKEAKQKAIEVNNISLINLCEAHTIYMECKNLEDEAEKLWNKIVHSEINERDNKCAQLSIQRDKIIKKLKDGAQYALDSNSPELVAHLYSYLAYHLYRRCDRNRFFSEIETYHRKSAVIFECLAWKYYPTNKEESRKYLKMASFQYLQSSLDNDRDRISEILINAFEMSDYDYFSLKAGKIKTIEDIENLEMIINKKNFDRRDSILLNLKYRKALLYKRLAVENTDDNISFFISAQYYEEYHKDEYKDSEMSYLMGKCLFLKSRGNLRLAINDGLFTISGQKHLSLAIEQINKSIDVSDSTIVEHTYLSIYKTIGNFASRPRNDLTQKIILETLSNVKFMKGQENFCKEKKILIYMEQLFKSIISDDKISALNYMKNIDNIVDIELFSKHEEENDIELFSNKKLNKEQFIEIWNRCKTESDTHKKGKLLEQFTVNLFSTIKGFICVGSNINTINEEFDVIFRNDIDMPFLQALNSPHFLFECKNWSKKIGIGEVKAFSADIDDHRNLVKVGIFIAVNGFEAGCKVQQTRMSATEKILILVTGEEIEKFLNSTKDTLEWLEDLISSAFK